MRLYCLGISRLRQNFKQFIIRKEVEARKGSALCFKIVFKCLCDFFKLRVVVGEFFLVRTLGVVIVFDDLRVFFDLYHPVFPKLIDSLELFGFIL